MNGAGWYHLSSTCYQHQVILGASEARMTGFMESLLGTVASELGSNVLAAWCILPNHYHVLILAETSLNQITKALGQVHGRTSRQWNLEDRKPGRTCWYSASDRGIRNEDHYWAVVNYIHHNPVKHGHAKRWQDWPWSSARDFLARVPRNEARRIWREHPLLTMGKGWDD
jgi:putative transposase